ncbi:MAG: CoA-binding protein [Actinobacteria bacterium]|nr:CoA-binding protein [Actinomycetota bacterium]MBU1943340.1 CoA-binding protein [Actinomycetota bacterium]MBU2686542.1 CoA-binding protein [Actinomycetota bacterium]
MKRISEQLDHLFEPRTIAVIGASNRMGKWGYIVPANILAGGYKGKVYPVNPKETEILECPCCPSIMDIDDEIDLAVVTIPAERVVPVIEQCVEKGVRTCIVISGGFSETGERGAELEREMVAALGESDMRLVGPNTMGIYSGPVSLHALMPPVRPVAGKIAFAAQSGNLGTQMLSLGKALGVGFSRFVCIGNESELKCADYLEYFAEDPATEVILLYIEGLREARRFVEVAAETSPRKPIVVMKAGKTDAGARAARSHSAALAADESIFDGVMKQAGMIEADTTEEMLDIAKAFAAIPHPRGRRVGVLTWGGGWGVVTADALAKHGLELVRLPDETLAELDAVLPPYWSRGNPVDLVGTLDLSMHFRCLEIIVRCEVVDSVITLGTMGATSSFQSFVLEGQANGDVERDTLKPRVIGTEFLSALQKTDEAYRNEVKRLMNETSKPIIAVSFPTSGAITPMLARQSEVVIYPSPERGAKTLAALYEYHRFLDRERALA